MELPFNIPRGMAMALNFLTTSDIARRKLASIDRSVRMALPPSQG
jgi:hypothetical protein